MRRGISLVKSAWFIGQISNNAPSIVPCTRSMRRQISVSVWSQWVRRNIAGCCLSLSRSRKRDANPSRTVPQRRINNWFAFGDIFVNDRKIDERDSQRPPPLENLTPDQILAIGDVRLNFP